MMGRETWRGKEATHDPNMLEAVLWYEHVWLSMEMGHWCLLMM